MEDLVYFMVIWCILRPFGICYGHLVYLVAIWYIFPALVCCIENNLATLGLRAQATGLMRV
jgi:hypothetical protein